MTVRFTERRDSRSSTDEPKQLWLRYSLEGITSDTTARAYCRTNIPTTFSGLYRHNIRLEAIGYGAWDVEAEFTAIPSEFRWSFDTTGGTAHITNAVAHVADYGPTGTTPPDHNGAIGVTADGGIEGCDIGVSARKWTESYQLPAASVPFTYGDILEQLTFTVNGATFRGKGRGYVLFLGASGGGSSKDPDIVEMTYSFASGMAIQGQTICGIKGVSKLPWEYLWYEYRSEPDDNAKRVVQTPLAIHREQVYYYGNFALLGIGTGVTPG